MRKEIIIALAGITVLATAAAAAPHGKAGLWTITTTTKMNLPQLPPDVLAMMKRPGMPGMGQPVTNRICMTEQQAKMETPPHVDTAGVTCSARVVSQTGNSSVSEATCHGRMDGTGRTTISWRGETHYDGTYDFKGTMGGRSQEISSQYSADWVKADCGAVKPFDASAINRSRPPAPR